MRRLGQTDPYYLEMIVGVTLLAWTGLLIALPLRDLDGATMEQFYEIVTLHHRRTVETVGSTLSISQIALTSCCFLGRFSPMKLTIARMISSFMQCWLWMFLTFGLFQTTQMLGYIVPVFALYSGVALSNSVLVFIHIHRLAECLTRGRRSGSK